MPRESDSKGGFQRVQQNEITLRITQKQAPENTRKMKGGGKKNLFLRQSLVFLLFPEI